MQSEAILPRIVFLLNRLELGCCMRPKIVFFTLLLGVGALVLIGVLHGMLGKPESENPLAGSGGAPAELTNTPSLELAQPEVKPAATSIIATTSAEDRATQKEKDLEAISDVLISGDSDPRAVFAISSRLENADEEVRTAAREAAVHLGDTNVIPYLASALEHLNDSREKVAIMDAIAYLQLPSESDKPMPDGAEALPVDLNAPGVKVARPRTADTNGVTLQQQKARHSTLRKPGPAAAAPQQSP